MMWLLDNSPVLHLFLAPLSLITTPCTPLQRLRLCCQQSFPLKCFHGSLPHFIHILDLIAPLWSNLYKIVHALSFFFHSFHLALLCIAHIIFAIIKYIYFLLFIVSFSNIQAPLEQEIVLLCLQYKYQISEIAQTHSNCLRNMY